MLLRPLGSRNSTLQFLPQFSGFCVRACVRARARACVCVRACVPACAEFVLEVMRKTSNEVSVVIVYVINSALLCSWF